MTTCVDSHGHTTDDANRWLGGDANTFSSDPMPDWDGMEYDAERSGPKCGGSRILADSPDGRSVGCSGCRHCDPVDLELKPHGFGIERFEDPALGLANAAMWAEIDKRGWHKYVSAGAQIVAAGFLYAGRWTGGPCMTDADREFRDSCWQAWSRWSEPLWRRSERVWIRFCDESETHDKAVAAYKAWAKAVVGGGRH